MSSIIQITDFKGFFKLSRNSWGDTYIQSLIDRFELYYLNFLLTKEIKDAYLLDANQEWALPFVNEYSSIYCCNSSGYIENTSKGFKDVLLNLCYYEIARLVTYNASMVGLSTPQEANARIINSVENEKQAEIRWNDAVESMSAICKKFGFKNKIKYKYLDLF